MDLTIVEKEVSTWAPEDQDRLAAFLAMLRVKRSEKYARKLSKRVEDRDPGNWVSLDGSAGSRSAGPSARNL